jgi:hypothetical protein
LAKTIENTKLVIGLIDMMERHMDLLIQEWNFRVLLQQHLSQILDWQKNYWKECGKIKWVTSGDAVTNFFHAEATIRHRQSLIQTMEDSDGNIVQGHEGKAKILWEAYNQRLGTFEYSHMYFDLQLLLTTPEILDCLEEPFTKGEIDSIIQHLPTDQSLCLDGFNGDFLKRCWQYCHLITIIFVKDSLMEIFAYKALMVHMWC